MPKLGNVLDFAQLEAISMRIQNAGTAPTSPTPLKGQMYFNSTANELFYYDGTVWQSAKSGAGSSGPPSGPAGGDLTGTYPNPLHGVGSVTASHILDGTITDAEVAAANKGGAAGVMSLRTLGTGSTDAVPGNARVTALGSPNVPFFMNSQRLINVADPTTATDAATKQYVDALAQGLDAKQSVKVATDTNHTLSGTTSIDGVTLVVGDRVLVKSQTTAAQNGIYDVAVGAWTRSTDMDAWAEVPGAFVFIEQGPGHQDEGWVCTANQGGTLGTTAIDWVKFATAGMPVAGAGLTSSGGGSQFDVGAGTGITVAADTVGLTVPVAVANGGTGGLTAGAARSALSAAGFSQFVGPSGSSATMTILQSNHGLNASRGIIAQVATEPGGAVVLPDVVINASGDVTITWAAAVAANSHRVCLVG